MGVGLQCRWVLAQQSALTCYSLVSLLLYDLIHETSTNISYSDFCKVVSKFSEKHHNYSASIKHNKATKKSITPRTITSFVICVFSPKYMKPVMTMVDNGTVTDYVCMSVIQQIG